MASFKILAAATCLLVSAVQARPGGHAESYISSNLESHGGLGLSGHGGLEGYGGGLSLGGHSGGLSLGGHSGLSLGGHGGLSLGGHGGGLALASYGGHGGHHEEIYADHHPKYNYKYGVEDKHTGDYKDAKEERDGDIVHGEYSLLQPDGRKRIVHYTASKHGGFNAHVSYSGHAIHPEYHQQSSHHLY